MSTKSEMRAISVIAEHPPCRIPLRSNSGSPTPTHRSINSRGDIKRSQSVSPSMDNTEAVEMMPGAESDLTVTISRSGSQSEESAPLRGRLPRLLAAKRRDFGRAWKTYVAQQSAILAQYAELRDLEARCGAAAAAAGRDARDLRVVSLRAWPAHDLLLLLRDDACVGGEVDGVVAPEIMLKVKNLFSSIVEELAQMSSKLLVNSQILAPVKTSGSSISGISHSKLCKKKADEAQEKSHKIISDTVAKIQHHISKVYELSRIPWIDRDTLAKKNQKLQVDITALQAKLDSIVTNAESAAMSVQALQAEEKRKESSVRAADSAVKEASAAAAAAQGLLRAARARVTATEKQLLETRAELDGVRAKNAELERLLKQQETNLDVRSKRLLQATKTGEMTIESLSKQRDAFELRVKELQECLAKQESTSGVVDHSHRNLHDMVAAKNKELSAARERAAQLEAQVSALQARVRDVSDRSEQLLAAERDLPLHCMPKIEAAPNARETQLWQELQATRAELRRATSEVRECRDDKQELLASLQRIAKEEKTENLQKIMAADLIDKEQVITNLQTRIRNWEQEHQTLQQQLEAGQRSLLAARQENKELRQSVELEPYYQELQNEICDLCLTVEKLSSERAGLSREVAAHALLLERYERGGELFASVLRARRELAAAVGGRALPAVTEAQVPQIARSVSAALAPAAATWSALRAERERVQRLEHALRDAHAQAARERRARLAGEGRRAALQRDAVRCCAQSLPNLVAAEQ